MWPLNSLSRVVVGRCCAAVVALCLCSSAFAQESPAAPSRADESYRIGPGDLLDVRVFKHPELSGEVRVNNDGSIRLHFIGEFQAACQTESQLVRVIQEKFKQYLRNPQVDVFIKDYRSQPVAVIGAVMQPARFQLQRRVKLFELLTYAGGPNQNAGNTLNLIRSGERHFCDKPSAPAQTATAADNDDPLADTKMMSFKLREIMLGSAEGNLYVEPGDIVTLPEAEQIYLIGNVLRPGPIPIRQKMRLTDAIAMAGGFFPDAAKKKLRLLRQSGTDTRQETVIDYEAVEKRQAEDIVLQPNDVIDVPNSTGKSIGRGFLNLIVPTAGALPLRVIRGY